MCNSFSYPTQAYALGAVQTAMCYVTGMRVVSEHAGSMVMLWKLIDSVRHAVAVLILCSEQFPLLVSHRTRISFAGGGYGVPQSIGTCHRSLRLL
jgi:hypothetical protein